MKRIFTILILICILMGFSGCVFKTVDEMYRLPKRSEEYNALQQVIDSAMGEMSYCAPVSGQQRQTVQMADLNGDGTQEYILFAKGNSEQPLQILIFGQNGQTYRHIDTIQCSGSVFDRVEYVQMDNRPGLEIVVGRQLSDQVLRSVSVYSFTNGAAEQLFTANYHRFLGVNLDGDANMELMILRPGLTSVDRGVVELYSIFQGQVLRSREVNMSEPIDKMKRILVGKLHGDIPAVYVASAIGESALITDVYALIDGEFTNVTFSNESGTSVKTLRNYYIYADDIDEDGITELPHLVDMRRLDQSHISNDQYIIRWYSMTTDGGEVDKICTYHDYIGGWYLELENGLAPYVFAVQQGNQCIFYLWDENYKTYLELMTIYTYTGQSRQTQGSSNGNFILVETDSSVYAASVTEEALSYGISKQSLPGDFHLIRQDWNTGET